MVLRFFVLFLWYLSDLFMLWMMLPRLVVLDLFMHFVEVMRSEISEDMILVTQILFEREMLWQLLQNILLDVEEVPH